MDTPNRVSDTEVMEQVYSVVPDPRMIWSEARGALENWTRKEISEAPSSTVIVAGTSNWTSTFSAAGSSLSQEAARQKKDRINKLQTLFIKSRTDKSFKVKNFYLELDSLKRILTKLSYFKNNDYL